MIKKNKLLLIITSIVTLLPIIVGLILWNKLPDQIPSHWGIDGNVDGWTSKPFAVFFFPAILLGVHWLCVLFSSLDPKHKNYHPKMLTLVLWICPVLCLVLSTLVYTAAMGHGLKVEVIMPLIMGLM